MQRLPRPSHPSWPACVWTELLLSGSPLLATLLAVHAVALPIALLASDLTQRGWASLGCLALAAVAAPEWSRLCLCRGRQAARRLRFTDDGRFMLDLTGGLSHAVTLAPRSLVAGPWLLLVLRAGAGQHRVLIERSRVEPACFAALVRSLRRVAAGPVGTRRALRSLIDPS